MIVFIYGISFLQGSIFALILLRSISYRSPVNKYLAYTILVISVLGLMNGIENQIGDSIFFIFELLNIVPLEMLFPATLFTFIVLKSDSKVFKGKHIYLYLPFYFFSVINCLVVILDSLGLIKDHNTISLLFDLFDFQLYLCLIYSFVTGLLSFIFINKATHLEAVNKKWLKCLVAIYFALILIWVFSELYEMVNDTEPIYLEYCLWVGVTSFFYWISYKGLIQFRLLEDRNEINQIIHGILSKDKKEIKKDISNTHFQKLEALMQNEHVYLDSNLSRENIADQIGISAGYLSKIVSSSTNNNFSEYINSYRVYAVKNMIQNPEFDKYSLLAIGYESGFTSKTGFYNAFKKQMGITPSEYKAKIKRS